MALLKMLPKASIALVAVSVGMLAFIFIIGLFVTPFTNTQAAPEATSQPSAKTSFNSPWEIPCSLRAVAHHLNLPTQLQASDEKDGYGKVPNAGVPDTYAEIYRLMSSGKTDKPKSYFRYMSQYRNEPITIPEATRFRNDRSSDRSFADIVCLGNRTRSYSVSYIEPVEGKRVQKLLEDRHSKTGTFFAKETVHGDTRYLLVFNPSVEEYAFAWVNENEKGATVAVDYFHVDLLKEALKAIEQVRVTKEWNDQVRKKEMDRQLQNLR